MDSRSARQRRFDLELRALLKETGSAHDLRRLIAVRLRDLAHLSVAEISGIVMLEPQTVRNIQSQYRRKGPKAVTGMGGRGGRRRQNASLARELNLLRRTCVKDPLTGLTVIPIKKLRGNYARWIKAGPADSTIYRLLARHRCTKVAKGLFKPPEQPA